MKSQQIIKSTLLLSFLFLMFSCKTLEPERMIIYDEITSKVLNESILNLEVGKSNIVKSNGVNIWYELIETKKDSAKGTILFIEGLEGTAMGWGDYIYQPILDEGFNVIRFDNREVGRSTWTENLDYDLSDMAKDVLTIINDLDLEAVNIVGQSMGGMIAQEFALNYPEKVKTLTLIYTSGNINDKTLPDPSEVFINSIIAAYTEYSEDDISSKIKLELASIDASNVNPLEREDLLFIARRTRYEIEKRKGKNEHASEVQLKAINQSGSRYDRLGQIKIPTLIIHGEKDPLINIKHGKKLASLIPHAKTVWAKDYGHNIPKDFSTIIVSNLIDKITDYEW